LADYPDRGIVGPGDLGGAISGAAVDENDLEDVRRKIRKHVRKVARLIDRRDHDADARHFGVCFFIAVVTGRVRRGHRRGTSALEHAPGFDSRSVV
jgi:hypothetical protein